MRLLSRRMLKIALVLTLFQICKAAPTENPTAVTAVASPAPELPTPSPAKKLALAAADVGSYHAGAPRPPGKYVERVIETNCIVKAGTHTGCKGKATAYVCIAPDAGMEFIVDTAEILDESSINDGVVSIVSKETTKVCARARASVAGANGFSLIHARLSAQEAPRK